MVAMPAAAYRKNRARFALLCKALAAAESIHPEEAEHQARGFVAMVTGGESSTKELDAHGWAHLFNWFESKGAKLARNAELGARNAGADGVCPGKPAAGKSYPEALPTHNQKWMVARLQEALGWDPEHLRKWMLASYGFAFYKDRKEAGKTFDGMKKALIDQARIAARIRDLLALSGLAPADRNLLQNVRAAISRKDASAARPMEVLRVIEMSLELLK